MFGQKLHSCSFTVAAFLQNLLISFVCRGGLEVDNLEIVLDEIEQRKPKM